MKEHVGNAQIRKAGVQRYPLGDAVSEVFYTGFIVQQQVPAPVFTIIIDTLLCPHQSTIGRQAGRDLIADNSQKLPKIGTQRVSEGLAKMGVVTPAIAVGVRIRAGDVVLALQVEIGYAKGIDVLEAQLRAVLLSPGATVAEIILRQEFVHHELTVNGGSPCYQPAEVGPKKRIILTAQVGFDEAVEDDWVQIIQVITAASAVATEYLGLKNPDVEAF